MILDAITSSPINVLFTIVIGIGLVYLYYRKPSSSSSSTSTASGRSHAHPNSIPNLIGGAVIDEELQRALLQIERQERDMIRQEQDEAYRKSLQADIEKRLKREEELKKKEAEEKAEKERLIRQEELHNKLMKLKGQIASKLPVEPSSDSEDIVKLVFKLPDGTRHERNFLKTDQVKYLYWFVFSLENAPLQFKMTTNFPKRDLPGRPPMPEDFEKESHESRCDQTLRDSHLLETQIIFVYDLDA